MKIRGIRYSAVVALGVALACVPMLVGQQKPQRKTLELAARYRVKDKAGRWVVRYKTLHWNPRRTAIVICDMWDDHYCRNAARRVAEMAPRMNEVITEARKQGVLIIHCPSGCMDVYKDTPQRKLAQQAPKVPTKVPLKGWCHLDPKHEPPLPIDDSDPCEDEKPRPRKRFYSRQIETLTIAPGDAITDSAEAYYLMRQKGIENVIIMGVHTNMCVLGRPFGIRQMVYQGMNVVLMRDMTDAMYNPKQRPYVPHVRGTELVVEHIEKHWCPTIVSTEFTGKAPFRFRQDDRPYVVMLLGAEEYEPVNTMPQLAHDLRDKHGCRVDVILGRGKRSAYRFPGLQALNDADLLVLFVRRRAIPQEQMALLRSHFKRGGALVALRTSSHAFDTKADPGYALWETFDIDVLGCDYRGHGPNKLGTDVSVVKANAGHAVLRGVADKTWHSTGSLYYSSPVDPKATILLEGTNGQKREPVAWVRRYGKSRVFYTSLGHPDDFERPEFRRMLVNAVFWAMDRQPAVKKH